MHVTVRIEKQAQAAAPADWPVDAVLPQRRHGSGTTAARPTQWYSSPNAAITAGSYKLRPSNTTGVRSAALMASKSGVRNSFHSVTMASASAPLARASVADA